MSAALVAKLRRVAEKAPREVREICEAAARTAEQDASLVGALAGLIPVGELLDATANGLTMLNYFRDRLAQADESRAIIRDLLDVIDDPIRRNGEVGSAIIARATAYLGEDE